MKHCLIVSALLALAGCAGEKPLCYADYMARSWSVPKPIILPEVIWKVNVVTEPPGAVIEINGEYRGKSPCELVVDGGYTLDNFGECTRDLIFTALPVEPGQYSQTKIFHAGSFGIPPDRVPSRVYFDLRLRPAPREWDVNLR